MADFASVNGVDAPSAGGLPSGIILIWTGTIANIPAGWVICDGNNGTPNLLDRFVQEVVNGSTNPGATGGSTAQTGNGHTHPFPSHSHTGLLYNPGYESTMTYGTNTVASTSHTHTVSNWAYGGGTSISGTASITDGRPKYYQVAFIMKT